jgi:proteasome lid subunit RPN8/RPN11
MEPKNSIRIQPTDNLMPPLAFIPLESSQRWDSPFDGEGIEPAVKVFLTQPAYALMCAHAGGELEEETGGVLVGHPCEDAETGQEFIVIEHALPARFTRQGSVFLTFTQDTLVYFHNEIEARFPGEQIVGWYHTHPKMGIFLSNYDTWLHNNFFPERWQVALVIEPHKKLGGFFIRQSDGALDPKRYMGFFEMEGNPERSIVQWNNLHRINGSPSEGD